MPSPAASLEVLHWYPDGTNHVVHLRCCLKNTVLFTQYEAVRMTLKRPLKPSVALIVVTRCGMDAPWQATMIKGSGQSRTVPLSVLVHHPPDVTDVAATPTVPPSTTAECVTSPPSLCTTPTRHQIAGWDATKTSIVSVKEVAVRPHVYSCTEQLLQQVNMMTDVLHPNIVRVLTTSTHNGFLVRTDSLEVETGALRTHAHASGALMCPAPTTGVTMSSDPSLVIVEEFCSALTVADCLCTCTRRTSDTAPHAPPLADPSLPGHRLAEAQVAAVLYDTLLAVRYLHDNCRLSHRHINTANLIVDGKRGKVMLRHSWEYTECTDVSQKPEPRSVSLLCTADGSATATLPDAIGHTSSFAADIWMLGITALEMLLGQTADRFKRVQRVAVAISTVTSTNQPAPALSDSPGTHGPQRQTQRRQLCCLYPEVFADMSDALLDFLARCLAAYPPHRATAQALLSHPFVAAARGQSVVEHSRVLGGIIALSEPPRDADESRGRRTQRSAAVDACGPSPPPHRGGRTHRRTSFNGSGTSLDSSPSTVAAYRSSAGDAGTLKRHPRDPSPRTGSLPQTASSTAAASAHASGLGAPETRPSTDKEGSRTSTMGADADASVDDSAVSPSRTWSTTSPMPQRASEVGGDERALQYLKAGFLRAMRGPSAVEAGAPTRTGHVAAVIPENLQRMVSSFPTQPRHRLGRRLHSPSGASSIESVGLRSFPLTFTVLGPALDATVSFLQTVSMALAPLSTEELVQVGQQEEWPYDMRRVRHYLSTTGPVPHFEEILSRLQTLNTQCTQLHNISPALTLQFVRTLATNYRNLERGKTQFLHRWVRLEQDVHRRLQQQHHRRTRAGAPPVGSGRRGGPDGAASGTSPASHGKGGRDSPIAASISQGAGTAPTVGDALRYFSVDTAASTVAPMTFTALPCATSHRHDPASTPPPGRAQHTNAAYFLFDRWVHSAPGTAF